MWCCPQRLGGFKRVAAALGLAYVYARPGRAVTPAWELGSPSPALSLLRFPTVDAACHHPPEPMSTPAADQGPAHGRRVLESPVAIPALTLNGAGAGLAGPATHGDGLTCGAISAEGARQARWGTCVNSCLAHCVLKQVPHEPVASVCSKHNQSAWATCRYAARQRSSSVAATKAAKLQALVRAAALGPVVGQCHHSEHMSHCDEGPARSNWSLPKIATGGTAPPTNSILFYMTSCTQVARWVRM